MPPLFAEDLPELLREMRALLRLHELLGEPRRLAHVAALGGLRGAFSAARSWSIAFGLPACAARRRRISF